MVVPATFENTRVRVRKHSKVRPFPLCVLFLVTFVLCLLSHNSKGLQKYKTVLLPKPNQRRCSLTSHTIIYYIETVHHHGSTK